MVGRLILFFSFKSVPTTYFRYYRQRNNIINLCESSFEEYSNRLNWRSAVQTVLNVMTAEGLS